MEIYHYCSGDKFNKIITSKKIWLTPIENMNDRDEIIHTYKSVWKEVKTKLENYYSSDVLAIEIIQKVDDHNNIIATFNDMPYLFCLSDEGDLLQQWRAYADDGKGFSICFDSEKLGVTDSLPHPNAILKNAIGIGTVIYNFDQQVDFLYKLVIEILNERQHVPMTLMPIYLIKNLKVYSAIFKHNSFNTEQEKRIIYYYSQEHKFDDNFVSEPSKNDGPDMHFELNWHVTEKNHSIKKVLLGPKNSYSEEEILRFLSNNGVFLKKENIFKSKSPYK